MAGNNRPPYRTPCAGWQYAWNGQKYQHGRRVEKSVPTYNQTNTSQTYRFPISEIDGVGSSCTSQPTNCGTNNPPRCGAFPYILQTPMVYELSGDAGDFSVCKQIGHKNVQARKSWHGRWGWCAQPEGANWEQLKYLSARIRVYSELEIDDQNPTTPTTKSGTREIVIDSTVGQNTGIITLNEVLDETLGDLPSTSLEDVSLPSLNYCDGEFYFVSAFYSGAAEDVQSEWETNWNYYVSDYQQSEATFDLTYNTNPATGFTITAYRQTTENNDPDPGDPIWKIISTETTTIEVTFSNAYSLQDVLDDCQTQTAEWDLSDNVEYPWRTDEYLTIAPLVTRDEVRVYTDAAGYQYDAVEPLMNIPNWNTPDYSSAVANGSSDAPFSAGWMADPAWTMITDKDPNSIKFDWANTFSAAQSNGYGGTESQWYNEAESTMATYAEANSIAYNRFTGNIRGAPSGYPGIFPDASYFDYEHITWYGASCDSGGSADFDGLVPYVERIGAKSGDNHDPTDSVVPIQSTQWTNNYDGCLFPPGAFIRVAGDSVHVQSSVFTLLPIPSMDYSRPCGVDRYRPDEEKTACVDSDNGTDVAVHADASAEIPSGSVCLVRSGGGNDGIFTLTTSDGLTYTRSGAKIADIPANVTYEPELDSDNFIAKVRFPNAPGICGRVSVTGATQDGASVHITLGETVYLQAGDKVDFTSVGGLGSNVNVNSVESATEFTITGTLSGAYSSGGYASSHGAASYYWHDDTAKGDYVTVQWYLDETGAVDSYNCETKCLPYLSCDPGVVGHYLGFTNFANQQVESFPLASEIIYDGTRDGVVWQGGSWVGMPDLYFQTPHTVKGDDCDTDYAVRDDDGGCNSDTVTEVFYPSAGRVEARCELPSIGAETAPALSGTALFPDFSTPPSAIATTYPGGDYNDILPVGIAVTEHGNYLAKYSCVCGEFAGRFSSLYESQGITCC